MIRGWGWYWFTSGKESLLLPEKCGKWMYFFTDQSKAIEICQKAIDEQICYECKCSDLEIRKNETGVLCFYLNGDDIENHKRVLQFMINNDLVQKTKSGRYYNMSFKYDNQTREGAYGDDFKGLIKLDKFIDLQSGKWRDCVQENISTSKSEHKKKTNYTRQIVDDYCVLDVETTGTDPNYNEIIEIAILRVRNNEIVDQYAQLIRPVVRIPSFITELTGITNKMVRNMPYIEDVKDEVLSFLGADIIVGHNTSFDVRFVNAAFEMKLDNLYTDTLQFSRKVFPELRVHKLDFLSRYFNLSNSQHRALADCIATKELYDLIKQTMQRHNQQVEDLWGSHGKNSGKSRNKKEETRNRYVGQEKLQTDGRIAKITEYRRYTDIDVILDDGSVINNTTIEKWSHGCVSELNSSRRMTKKEKMELLEKRYHGNPCSFGSDRACDSTCGFYSTCSRASKV